MKADRMLHHPSRTPVRESPAQPGPERNRRDYDSRDRLLRRIRGEFSEMPCLRLTEPQLARLFGLSDAVCVRVLSALVGEGTLWLGTDGRYGVQPSR